VLPSRLSVERFMERFIPVLRVLLLLFFRSVFHIAKPPSFSLGNFFPQENDRVQKDGSTTVERLAHEM